MSAGELSDEELDQALEFFQGLEDRWGWEKAVDMMFLLQATSERVRQIEQRAYEKEQEARVEGNTGEQHRFFQTGDSLSVLAQRAEKRERESA
jgi:hypothetical protein